MLAWTIGVALSVWLASAASSDCLNVNFYNWDSVCLGLTKNWSKNYEISIDKNNLEKNSTIRCYVVLPNNTMYSIYWCKWSFSYAWAGTKDVIVSAAALSPEYELEKFTPFPVISNMKPSSLSTPNDQ